MNAERAYQIGLIQGLAADRADLFAQVNAVADEIIKCSPYAVRSIKTIVKVGRNLLKPSTPGGWLTLTRRVAARTRDAARGPAGVRSRKRDPVWSKGRGVRALTQDRHAAEGASVTNLPLTGVKVLEVAGYFFVPAAGTPFSPTWGAEVSSRLSTRYAATPSGASRPGGAVKRRRHARAKSPKAGDFRPVYEQGNRGKRAIGLDLATPQGLAVLTKLVERSDVFLTNLLPGSRKHHVLASKRPTSGQRTRTSSMRTYADRGTVGAAPAVTRAASRIRASGPAPGVASAADAARLLQPLRNASTGLGLRGRNRQARHSRAGGIAAALYQRATTGEGAEVDASLLGVGMWANEDCHHGLVAAYGSAVGRITGGGGLLCSGKSAVRRLPHAGRALAVPLHAANRRLVAGGLSARRSARI